LKKLLCTFITFWGVYYFLKYKGAKERYDFELVDIESCNDLLREEEHTEQ